MKIIRLKNYIGQAIANQGDYTIDYDYRLLIFAAAKAITRYFYHKCNLLNKGIFFISNK